MKGHDDNKTASPGAEQRPPAALSTVNDNRHCQPRVMRPPSTPGQSVAAVLPPVFPASEEEEAEEAPSSAPFSLTVHYTGGKSHVDQLMCSCRLIQLSIIAPLSDLFKHTNTRSTMLLKCLPKIPPRLICAMSSGCRRTLCDVF